LSHSPEVSKQSLLGTFAVVLAATMTTGGAQTGFGVLYPAMMQDRGWTAAELTFAYSFGQLAYGPAALSAGFLVDRFGIRPTMLAGCALVSVGLCLLAIAESLTSVYLAWILGIGVGLACAGYVPAYKLLSIGSGRHLGLGLGIGMAGFGVGTLIILPSLQLLIDLAGWRTGAAGLAVWTVVVLTPLVAAFAPTRSTVAVAEHPVGARRVGLLRQPILWLFWVATLNMGYLLLLAAHQVAHLLQVGYPAAYAAGAAGLAGMFQAVGALLAGFATDRWGSRWVMIVAGAVFIMGVVGLAASSPANPSVLILYVLGAGPGRSALNIGLARTVRDSFPTATLGRVAGLMEIAFSTGAFLGTALAAVIQTATGSYVPGLLTAIPAVFMLVLCVATRPVALNTGKSASSRPTS
jgi:MFS family permease